MICLGMNCPVMTCPVMNCPTAVLGSQKGNFYGPSLKLLKLLNLTTVKRKHYKY